MKNESFKILYVNDRGAEEKQAKITSIVDLHKKCGNNYLTRVR